MRRNYKKKDKGKKGYRFYDAAIYGCVGSFTENMFSCSAPSKLWSEIIS